MGATEEQMALLSGLHVTHVSYILILYSFAFLLLFFVFVLLHIYASHAWPLGKIIALPITPAVPNPPNGGLVGMDPRVKDAEEFELQGLMSDDETEAGSSESVERRRKETEPL